MPWGRAGKGETASARPEALRRSVCVCVRVCVCMCVCECVSAYTCICAGMIVTASGYMYNPTSDDVIQKSGSLLSRCEPGSALGAQCGTVRC